LVAQAVNEANATKQKVELFLIIIKLFIYDFELFPRLELRVKLRKALTPCKGRTSRRHVLPIQSALAIYAKILRCAAGGLSGAWRRRWLQA
jgi:hypothetical protein